MSSPVIRNGEFAANSAESIGGAIYTNASSPLILNCSFFANDAGLGGAIGVQGLDAEATTLVNSIVWGNTTNEIQAQANDPIVISHCDVAGALPAGAIDGGGNISTDPGFVSTTAPFDLHLGPCSPAIDAGDRSAVPAGVVTDRNGDPRLVDDAWIADTGSGGAPLPDLGAYERQTDSGPTLTLIVPGPPASIQVAIDAAPTCGAEVVISPGTYVETIDFGGKAVVVRSASGDPTDTIIDGNGAPSVVTCNSGEGPNSVLAGVTITGGHATSVEGGGGMHVKSSAPTVIDCIFDGNVSDTIGGGLALLEESFPTLIDCTFIDNESVTNGGGISVTEGSSIELTGVTFSSNGVSMFDGGGLLVSAGSSASVTACLFDGNSANGGGGAAVHGTATTPSQITGSGSITVAYSNVQNGYPGDGNIDADPLFVDPAGGDLHLLPGSPCVDAGLNAAVPGDVESDLDGNARFVDAASPDCPQAPGTCGDAPVVDMGPYELPFTCLEDVDGDGAVGVTDLVAVILAWGSADPAADVDGDGIVGVTDLVAVILAWGDCS